MKNIKKIVIGVIVIVIAFISGFICNMSFSKNDYKPITETTVIENTTLEVTTEKEENPIDLFDRLIYQGTQKAQTATDEELEMAYEWLKDNNSNFFDDKDQMETAIICGAMLECANQGSDNKMEKIGWQVQKAVKYVYVGIDTVDERTTADNMHLLQTLFCDTTSVEVTTNVAVATTIEDTSIKETKIVKSSEDDTTLESTTSNDTTIKKTTQAYTSNKQTTAKEEKTRVVTTKESTTKESTTKETTKETIKETTTKETTIKKAIKDTDTVYLTKTGSKYHNDGCKYLKSSRIPISMKDAKKKGFEPCSVCFE